jgi:hypothetical protein
VPFRPTSISICPDSQAGFDQLNRKAAEGKQPERAIWKAVLATVARIRNDGQWGEIITPRSTPRRYSRDFGATNLYCVDLPSFYRLFYTIRDRDIIILEIGDHREYDRLMKG